ncbi:14753_t:CDS:2, partial [Acaulospora morrowiae]
SSLLATTATKVKSCDGQRNGKKNTPPRYGYHNNEEQKGHQRSGKKNTSSCGQPQSSKRILRRIFQYRKQYLSDDLLAFQIFERSELRLIIVLRLLTSISDAMPF